MRGRLAALVLAVVWAAQVFSSTVSFEFVGETSGDPALRFVGRGFVDRQASRYDYVAGNHALFREKMSIRSADGGAILAVVDNSGGTYFLRATREMSGMISAFRAPWEKSIEGVRVQTEALGREKTPHDFRVERVRLTVGYRIAMEVDGESLFAEVECDADLLVAPKYRTPGLPWGHQFALKTGWAEVDEQVAAKVAKLGFPLEQVVTVRRTIDGGDEVTETSTFKVTRLREVAFAGSGFAPPAGYRFREPTFTGPSIKPESVAAVESVRSEPAIQAVPPLPIREVDPRTAPPLFVETMEVRVINVDVIVRDKGGIPVSGLTADDFEILENGRPVEISNFLELSETSGSVTASAAAGRSAPTSLGTEPGRRRKIVLFIDQNSLHPQNRRTLIPAMKAFVIDAMRTGDEVMVASFRNGLNVDLQFTSNPDVVVETIDRMVDVAPIGRSRTQRLLETQKSFINLVNQFAMIPVNPGEPLVQPPYDLGLTTCRSYAEEIELEANLVIGSIEALMKALAPVGGRKLVVFATEALPTRPGVEIYHYFDGIKDLFEDGSGSSPIADSFNYNLGPRIENLADVANSTSFTLYPVQARTLSSDFLSADVSGDMQATYTRAVTDAAEIRHMNDRESLLTLARLTGGTASLAANDFSKAFQVVVDDLEHYYSIGYRAVGERSDFVRSIKVNVKDRDLVARTRRSHIDRSVEAEMEEYVAANLFYPIERNELGITAAAGESTPDNETGSVNLTLRVDIPTDTLTLVPSEDDVTGSFTLFIGFIRADGSVSKITRDTRQFSFPSSTLSRRKSITMALDVTMDATTNRISVGVLDPVSKAAGFTSAFIEARKPQVIAAGQ